MESIQGCLLAEQRTNCQWNQYPNEACDVNSKGAPASAMVALPRHSREADTRLPEVEDEGVLLMVTACVLHVGAHVLYVDARPRAADQHLRQAGGWWSTAPVHGLQREAVIVTGPEVCEGPSAQLV